MNLARDAREYVWWPIAGVPADAAPAQVKFSGDPVWYTGEWTATGPEELAPPTGFTRWLRILVAGPSVDDDQLPHPEGTAQLPVGRHPVRIRLIDSPEVTPRDGGLIQVS